MALIEYKGKNIYSCGGKFRLIPGLNEVENSLLAEALKHPIFKQRVEAGSIVLIENVKDNSGKVAINEMKKNIKNTFDRKLLEKILSQDQRPEVQAAAQEQLDKIKHPSSGAKKNVLDEAVEHFGGSYHQGE